MVCWRQGRIQRVYNGMLEAWVDLEGLPWYAGGREIQRVYNGMLEGRGGSREFTMVCWKAGADPEGLQWYAGGRGGSRGFTMVC